MEENVYASRAVLIGPLTAVFDVCFPAKHVQFPEGGARPEQWRVSTRPLQTGAIVSHGHLANENRSRFPVRRPPMTRDDADWLPVVLQMGERSWRRCKWQMGLGS